VNQPARTTPQMLRGACTNVLVQLTVKSAIDPQRVMPHMPAEIRDTVLLYLEGHISQWWSLCDRPGVVFLFNATGVEEVQRLMATLPLVHEDLVDLAFTRLGPLTPLRILLDAET